MTPHKNHHKLEILNRIYALHDETMQNQKTMCEKGCASCCTCNVTMTGLEAAYLADALDEKAKAELKNAMDQTSSQKHFIPKTTTNQFARLCMEGTPVPEEENDPAWGKCPALKENICTVYDARPFGCRALLSEISCAENGYAQVPPEFLTINTVFLQAIEHLDQNGISGNFSDIMPLFLTDGLADNKPTGSYREMVENIRERIKDKKSRRFTANEKILVLMIEPELREKLSPIVQILSSFLKED